MSTGDMIATMMAWLNTPKNGGETGFIYPNREMLVGKPKSISTVCAREKYAFTTV